MHITPYQATRAPSTGAPIAGTPKAGTEPFTMDVMRSPMPAALDSLGAHVTSAPIGSTAEDSIPAASDSAASDSAASDTGSDDLKEAFQDFVGQTFFGEMIKSFRTTQQPSKYFHGGRAEEIFQGQFDQVLTEKLSDASAEKISDPMYELFMLKRSS
ncbi:MAG: rod-binding protein [Planctomycetales bacterium]|nr:rod-binding protein [Planctomycetales bacterium]